jgi:hypothetical protein
MLFLSNQELISLKNSFKALLDRKCHHILIISGSVFSPADIESGPESLVQNPVCPRFWSSFQKSDGCLHFSIGSLPTTKSFPLFYVRSGTFFNQKMVTSIFPLME